MRPTPRGVLGLGLFESVFSFQFSVVLPRIHEWFIVGCCSSVFGFLRQFASLGTGGFENKKPITCGTHDAIVRQRGTLTVIYFLFSVEWVFS